MASLHFPATPRTPRTPGAQTPQEPTPTGAWKHPQFNEITRRQYATTFDESNVRTIVVNAFILGLSWVCLNVAPHVALLRALQNATLNFLDSVPYSNWMIGAFRGIFIASILTACWPLVLRYYPDEIADIALTPSQRLAMGLDPDVVPTPKASGPGSSYASPNYVTPPRYQKSTPRSGFGTPGSGSPRGTSKSPYSPLLHQAVAGSSMNRSSNNGRSSPTNSGNSSSFFNESSIPSTPTPGGGKASVGLNSKWLYEKRRDSRGSSLF